MFEGNTAIIPIKNSEKVEGINLIDPSGEIVRNTNIKVGETQGSFTWHKGGYTGLDMLPPGDYKFIAVGTDESGHSKQVGEAAYTYDPQLKVEAAQMWNNPELDIDRWTYGSVYFTLSNPGDAPVPVRGVKIKMDNTDQFKQTDMVDWREEIGAFVTVEEALQSAVVTADKTTKWEKKLVRRTDFCTTDSYTGTVEVHLKGGETKQYNIEVAGTGEHLENDFCVMKVKSFEPVE